jgi:hypothetical protein
MPINPNIALGAQQQQPVNMLGQMGQMMALKAASQDIQGNEDLRNFYASGGNASTPEGARALMAANPKMGMQILKNTAETQKTQMEALGKEVALRRDAITNIRTPEDYLNWHDANHQGNLGAFFKSAGISPSRESIIAQLNQPGGLDKLKRESALGATALQKELMQTERSVQVANIGAGPGNRQASIAEQNFAIQKADRAELDALYGRPSSAAPATTPMGGGGGGGGGSSIMVNPAQSNALIQGTAPALSPNMLRPDAQAPATAPVAATPGDLFAQITAIDARIAQLPMNNPKAIPIAQALNAQRTALLASAKNQYGGNLVDMQVPDPADPSKTITIKGRTDQYGRVVPAEIGAPPLSVDASATGGTTINPSVVRAPLTAGQEKTIETARVKEEGQKTVNTVLGTLNRQYQGLVNEGGITDTSKSTLANLKASASSNVAGQMVGRAVGSKAQQFRDSVAQTRPLLLNAIKNASGMSAQQLNSNVELQTYLKAATDTELSIQANVEAMNNISKLFGLGEEFKIEPPAKKGSSASPSTGGVALPKGFKLD